MSDGPTEIWKYLERKFVSLGADALSRRSIYLDTNFWAMLRDHQSGRNVRHDVAVLLQTLRELVASGAVFCTFSGHTLSELMKHRDPSVRHLTAGLMDELSCGFCLANQDRLFSNEVIAFLSSIMAPSMDRWSLSRLAWTKPFFLLMDYQPPGPGLGNAENLKLQMGFVDHVWFMPMVELIERIDSFGEPYPQLEWPRAAADSINEEVRRHDHENSSLHEFYLSELNGFLEWAEPKLVARYCEFTTRYGVGVAPIGDEHRRAIGMMLRMAAMSIAKRRELASLMPGTHVRSMLHAMIRFDRTRRFKANDLMDIEHAETSLAHCNYLFTDKPHAHLIRSAKLDAELRCVVSDSPGDAVSTLSDLR